MKKTKRMRNKKEEIKKQLMSCGRYFASNLETSRRKIVINRGNEIYQFSWSVSGTQ